MNEVDFQDRLSRLRRATEIAREILAVPPGASQDVLRKARRRAYKKYHPDCGSEREAEGKSLRLVQLAYRCLKDGEECEKLLRAHRAFRLSKGDESEKLENRWAYFLSWRKRFF